MVGLLIPSAFAETGALLGKVTGLEAVHAKIVLFDQCDHLVMGQSLKASEAYGCFSVLQITQLELVPDALATIDAGLVVGRFLYAGLSTLAFRLASADAHSAA